MVKSIYEAYLKQELIEPNPELHLKKGVLKEFSYGCCDGVSQPEATPHNKVIGLSGSTGNAMQVAVQHRHVHVEAGTSYSTTGGTNGKQRCKINSDLNPENYMKSKFDKKGNTL